MTLNEWLKEQLKENGLSHTEAEAVSVKVKEHPTNKAMTGRWNHDVSEYPQPLLSALWATSSVAALEWIDENCPQAWFRAMFEA